MLQLLPVTVERGLPSDTDDLNGNDVFLNIMLS